MSEQTKQIEDQAVDEQEKEKNGWKNKDIFYFSQTETLTSSLNESMTIQSKITELLFSSSCQKRRESTFNQHASISTIRLEECICTLAASRIIMMQSLRIWHRHQKARIVGTDKGVMTSLSQMSNISHKAYG